MSLTPTSWQRLIASDALLRAWITAGPIICVVFTFYAGGFHRVAFTGVWWFLLAVVSVALAGALGYFAAGLAAWPVFGPILMDQGEQNGGPYHIGDCVMILSGDHRDRITHVYSYGQHETLRLELGRHARDHYEDIFAPYQLIRVDAKDLKGVEPSQMETRAQIHERAFQATAEELFDLLVTPSAIRQWWSAKNAIVLAQPHGFWSATWGDDEDDPDYIVNARIQQCESPKVLVLDHYQYFAKSGPLPFDADFVTSYHITDEDDGAKLRVSQTGFPMNKKADEYYEACGQGWRDTLDAIEVYLKSRPS